MKVQSRDVQCYVHPSDTNTLRSFVTQEWGGYGAERIVTKNDIATFATLTNNHQWIHEDELRCMHESIYRGLIAHGLFIVTLIPGLLPSERFVISPYTHRIVRGIEHLRILAPVYPGDTVRVRTRLKRVVPAQSGKGVILSRDVECWTQANVKPVVVCTLLLQYF